MVITSGTQARRDQQVGETLFIYPGRNGGIILVEGLVIYGHFGGFRYARGARSAIVIATILGKIAI